MTKLRAPPSVWRARGFSLGLQGARSASPGPSLGSGSPGARVSRPSCRGRAGPPRFSLQPPVQFSSVPFSRSVVSDSLRPQGLQHARPPCPSNSTSVESVMPSNHLILCRPLLLPPSIFPRMASKLWFKKKNLVEKQKEQSVFGSAPGAGVSFPPLCSRAVESLTGYPVSSGLGGTKGR